VYLYVTIWIILLLRDLIYVRLSFIICWNSLLVILSKNVLE